MTINRPAKNAGFTRKALITIAPLYLGSVFVHIENRAIVIGPPRVLSGDSPHYLVVVNSLIEDGDFDISNNYRQGEAGDVDLGRRLRGTPIDHHVDRTSDGKELSVHAPFLPMALAPVAWPFRGSEWVEPVCIFVSLAVAFAGVVWFARGAGWSFAIMLALATPLWSYARDLWTEPWAAAAWVGLMFSRHPGVLAVLAFSGTVLKYPFALVPMIMGAFAFQERDYRRAAVLLGAPVLALLFSIVFIQYLYQDVPHFSLFHLGSHAGFNWPFDGIYGLLLDPVDGLLWFSWLGRPLSPPSLPLSLYGPSRAVPDSPWESICF